MSAVDGDFAVIEAMEDELFGDSVVYARGESSVTITAIASEVNRFVESSSGVGVQISSRAYECNAADIVIGGEQVEPRNGDIITETIDGASHVYEVMPLSDEPCFDWLDAAHRRILIYTKRIE